MNAPKPLPLLVFGDLMLDIDTLGNAERVSPEAPVLVLKAESQKSRLGGAGAVTSLVAALGALPIVAGVVGEDHAGDVVRRLVGKLLRPQFEICNSPCLPAAHLGAICNGHSVLLAADRPTTVKERLIGKTAGRHGQQMLRVDRESSQPLPEPLEDKLCVAALATLDDVEAVLISDYGKGVCTPKVLCTVIDAARSRNLPVLVDPRRGADYENYRGATLIKPNRREAGEATGCDIRSVTDAFTVGDEICTRYGFSAAVITLDADGMVLVTADGLKRHFATRDRQVVDVTGAGDTVLAVLSIALARGLDLERACELANAAAGLQVEHLGVAPIEWEDVESVGNALGGVPAMEDGLPSPSTHHGDGLGRPSSREGRGEGRFNHHPVTASANLQFAISRHRQAGRRIVFTNGCFDLLHAGHFHCLTAAKALGDVLIVALNSDDSVRRLKGPSRPIVGQAERAAMLAALRSVDHVLIFDDDTPEHLIAELRPDVLVKGDEPRPDGIPGASLVTGYGGRVVTVPLRDGYSTTTLIDRACCECNARICRNGKPTDQSKIQNRKSKIPQT